MFNSSNILIKYILLFCNIITLCFVLHTKQLLANTNEKDKNTELILKIISLVENNKLQQINKLLAKNSDVNLDDLVNWLMISNVKEEKGHEPNKPSERGIGRAANPFELHLR